MPHFLEREGVILARRRRSFENIHFRKDTHEKKTFYYFTHGGSCGELASRRLRRPNPPLRPAGEESAARGLSEQDGPEGFYGARTGGFLVV